MKKEVTTQFFKEFEKIVLIDEETGMEFWLARQLQKVLGYLLWQNFQNVINKAKQACAKSGQ